MSEGIKKRTKKEPTLGIALIPIVALMVFLYVGLVVFEQDPHIPLVAGSCVAVAVAIFMLGNTWADLEDGILKTINMGMQACLILMIIGMLIGSWIMGGIVPSMIYYGLQIISPSIFLVAAVILCSIVSIASGSSWTTAGTVGVALIGVGQGIGIPAPVAAGAIISGAYFGDKMSPLSDTTNLAPAMAGATLFDHIRHMIYTTGPSYIITLIIFGVMSVKYAGQQLDAASIDSMLSVLDSNFTINLLMIVPPILVIAMVIFKVPAIPGLLGGVTLGAIFAVVFQGVGLGSLIDILQNGYSFEMSEAAAELADALKAAIDSGVTGADTAILASAPMELIAEVNSAKLLSNGGMQSMMWTVSLIICALSFGGILEATGMLEVLAGSLLKLAKGTGSLVFVTIFSSIFINVIASDQYLSIVIPGRMYKDAYADRGLSPRNLSRTLEDGGTITSPLIPWNTCGAAMTRSLKVSTQEYLPYCFFNILNPVISILMAFLGFGQMKMTDAEREAYERSKAALKHEA
ncbi:MAG: Na+/H+ antiporter NhaC [Peptostreptococcaceae bacterium]|nr:Na+/H+ antiporter NhaC [Peptostreptococcaceae bacterium]